MHKIKLAPAELEELKALKKQEKNQRIFRRLQCIQLCHQGKEHKEIAETVGVCVDTITDWIRLFEAQGMNGLRKLAFKDKRKSAIGPHVDSIKQDVKNNNIATLAELQSWLKDHYKLELESSWLSRLCKKNSICLTRKLA